MCIITTKNVYVSMEHFLAKYYKNCKNYRYCFQSWKLMSEIITAMKLVKMYAWEKPFARKIGG